MKKYPTAWQQKILWAAITSVAIALIGALAVILIVGSGRVLGFLQPILIPVAVAGILAYLLNPLVDRIEKRGVSRMRAVIYVLILVFLPLATLLFWVIPQLYDQSMQFAKEVPSLIEKGKDMLANVVQQYKLHANNPYVEQAMEWAQKQIPELPAKIWGFFSGGVQGFLGVFGLLVGMAVVPVYLFFLLANAGPISRRWSNYLPLRASPLKAEVVDCVMEINNYLIAFFRGQILVTMIDGAMIAVALLLTPAKFSLPLSFEPLNFALLIGLMVAVLQLVPYLGVFVCWAPAALIATVQFHDWQHPLWITLIFFIVTNLDGLVIAPRIVGGSVGLHPMTIIVSVFAWSLLVGGVLGALLAVPLTATLKVLLRRYVWEKQLHLQQETEPETPEQ